MSQEPLYTEIYRKNAAAQIEPRTWTHTLCKPAQSKCTSTFHKSHFIRKFKGKMPRPRLSPDTHYARACTVEMHFKLQHFTRATLYGNLQKNAVAQIELRTRTHTLCASLRSRNALQHVTRATLYGNLQEKCRGPD